MFLDLIAAYDTVGHRGLHMKLIRTIPNRHMVGFIMEMLSNRSFVMLLLFVWNTFTVSLSLDNHSPASGPAWCRRCGPPGNAVSGYSSTMYLVVWWHSPQRQAGDAITPHRWRDSAHLAWSHLRRFSVTNWRLGRVNPGWGHVGLVTRPLNPRLLPCLLLRLI